MASGEPIPLGSGFAGLDRATAPHLLQPDKSPATTDAGAFNDVFGILGPRRGRKKVANFNGLIRGIVPCNFPIGRFRLVGLNDGTVTATTVPWPTQSVVPPIGYTGTFLTTPFSCAAGVVTAPSKTLTFDGDGTLNSVV